MVYNKPYKIKKIVRVKHQNQSVPLTFMEEKVHHSKNHPRKDPQVSQQEGGIFPSWFQLRHTMMP